MASGHVNRVNRPNTWPQPTSCIVKKTLANREPSTHGTSQKWRSLRVAAGHRSKADSDKPSIGTFLSSRPQRWARARQEASAFGWTRSKAKAAHKIARKMESAALTMSGLPRLWNLTVCEATDANRTLSTPRRGKHTIRNPLRGSDPG